MARFGMLECGKNYKGTLKSRCVECDTEDTENHRMNQCKVWRTSNFYEATEKVDFDLVYSNDISILKV